jgi:hypothetical protein
MDFLLLRSLIKYLAPVCRMHWAVGSLCVVGFAGYMAFDLYLSWSNSPAVDLSAIEQRLSAIETKQDEILQLLQPQQAPQLSEDHEAFLQTAYQHMPAEFERDQLIKQLQGPPGQ